MSALGVRSYLRAHVRSRLQAHHDRPDDGQFLVMTVIFMTMFLVLMGLVVDGGRYIDARQAAVAEAEQAARAGAGSLDIGSLHAGNIQLDRSTAVSAAERYMAASGHPGFAWVEGATVYARISYPEPTQLLGLVGLSHMEVSVTERATNVSGITSEE